MTSRDTIPRKAERIGARVVDGKALIVVIDGRQLHTLNEVGTRVWELCDGRDLGAIADVVVEEFEVDRQVALADVVRFVDELSGVGALTLEPAA